MMSAGASSRIACLRIGLAAIAASLIASNASVAWSQDAQLVQRGRAAFAGCRSCHSTGAGEPHHTGPNLASVYGAPIASQPGFGYSHAMRSSSLRWDETTLDAFIARPATVVPGTRMAFDGVRDEERRRAIVAYLRSLASVEAVHAPPAKRIGVTGTRED